MRAVRAKRFPPDAEPGGGIHQWSYSYVPNRYAEYNLGLPTLRASGGDIGGGSEALVCVKEGFDMECYPKITGALCANSHPGSYTGQDAFNNMLPVIRRENDVLDMPENLRIYEGGVPQH